MFFFSLCSFPILLPLAGARELSRLLLLLFHSWAVAGGGCCERVQGAWPAQTSAQASTQLSFNTYDFCSRLQSVPLLSCECWHICYRNKTCEGSGHLGQWNSTRSALQSVWQSLSCATALQRCPPRARGCDFVLWSRLLHVLRLLRKLGRPRLWWHRVPCVLHGHFYPKVEQSSALKTPTRALGAEL